ncbi:MAG: DUF1850 domain-containing protein [Bacillota bacterium]
MRKSWLWIAIIGLALILLMNIPFIQSLEISDRKSGQILAVAPVHTGEQFTISFTHSIAKTPVDEVFVVGPGREIIVTETIYESFGAGLPFDTEGEQQQLITANGKYRLTNLDRHLPEFLQAVGTVANHQLIINGKQIPFTQFAQPGESVRIRVRMQSPLTYLLTSSLGMI